MDNGRCGPDTYRRPASELGPFGLLVREVFLDPYGWSSWGYLDAPESVADICQAACERFEIDLSARYERAAVPCIVEFTASSSRSETMCAVASVAWYAEGAARGMRPHDALLAFDGDGSAVPSESIVAVEVTVIGGGRRPGDAAADSGAREQPRRRRGT